MNEKYLSFKNQELYNNICLTANIESYEKTLSLLLNKGYDNYKTIQSIKNRFRSPRTRTDFFWDLLDATDCKIEVIKNTDKTREELLDEIETLKNEMDMVKINPNIMIMQNLNELAIAINKFKVIKDVFTDPQILNSLDLAYDLKNNSE